MLFKNEDKPRSDLYQQISCLDSMNFCGSTMNFDISVINESEEHTATHT